MATAPNSVARCALGAMRLCGAFIGRPKTVDTDPVCPRLSSPLPPFVCGTRQDWLDRSAGEPCGLVENSPQASIW